MKLTLQLWEIFPGFFRKVIAICNHAGTGRRMLLNGQPEREHSQTAQIEKIEREIRDFQKELAKLRREEDVLRFQPCQGDAELRQKEESIEGLKKHIKSLHDKIWELERKYRETRSEGILNPD